MEHAVDGPSHLAAGATSADEVVRSFAGVLHQQGNVDDSDTIISAAAVSRQSPPLLTAAFSTTAPGRRGDEGSTTATTIVSSQTTTNSSNSNNKSNLNVNTRSQMVNAPLPSLLLQLHQEEDFRASDPEVSNRSSTDTAPPPQQQQQQLLQHVEGDTPATPPHVLLPALAGHKRPQPTGGWGPSSRRNEDSMATNEHHAATDNNNDTQEDNGDKSSCDYTRPKEAAGNIHATAQEQQQQQQQSTARLPPAAAMNCNTRVSIVAAPTAAAAASEDEVHNDNCVVGFGDDDVLAHEVIAEQNSGSGGDGGLDPAGLIDVGAAKETKGEAAGSGGGESGGVLCLKDEDAVSARRTETADNDEGNAELPEIVVGGEVACLGDFNFTFAASVSTLLILCYDTAAVVGSNR